MIITIYTLTRKFCLLTNMFCLWHSETEQSESSELSTASSSSPSSSRYALRLTQNFTKVESEFTKCWRIKRTGEGPVKVHIKIKNEENLISVTCVVVGLNDLKTDNVLNMLHTTIFRVYTKWCKKQKNIKWQFCKCKHFILFAVLLLFVPILLQATNLWHQTM